MIGDVTNITSFFNDFVATVTQSAHSLYLFLKEAVCFYQKVNF